MERPKVIKRYETIREKYKTDKQRLKYCMTLDKAVHSENHILACFYDVFHGIQLNFMESCIKIPFASVKEKTPDGEDTSFVFPSFVRLRETLRKMPELEKLIKARKEAGQDVSSLVFEKKKSKKDEDNSTDNEDKKDD